MRSFSLPPVIVTVLDGDLSTREVDAIVNAANNAFWMGSGVAGAIKARGGVEIETEAMAQGPVTPGESVLTTGGRLPARHVIHAAAMGQDLQTDADLIRAATRSAIALAQSRQLTSIAFPALGTGVGGFPIDECAREMITVLREEIRPDTSLRSVEFVLFGARACQAFTGATASMLPPA